MGLKGAFLGRGESPGGGGARDGVPSSFDVLSLLKRKGDISLLHRGKKERKEGTESGADLSTYWGEGEIFYFKERRERGKCREGREGITEPVLWLSPGEGKDAWGGLLN